jgi:long-subunit acyl-CoA synthetase (AMP-forming)
MKNYADPEGWYHTEDIMEMLQDHGNAVRITDTKDNLVKISLGNVLWPVKEEPIYNL